MIMPVINRFISIGCLLFITCVILGCSKQTISIATLNKSVEAMPTKLRLTERDVAEPQMRSKGILILEGNCYVVSHDCEAIYTIGGRLKTSDIVFTRCQNFTLYSFFTNWPTYYPIVGECYLGHYLMQGRQMLFCSGGRRKVEYRNGRKWLPRSCFSIPYTGALNSKNTATIGDDAPLMLNEVVYLGNKIYGWFGNEYVIRDCEGNTFFQIQMSNCLDVESVALMESPTYGDLCWVILRQLRSSNRWLVACNIKSDAVFCKKLDTAGCVNYYFVDDSTVSKNPFLVKVVKEHLACTDDECLRKCYIKSFLTIDEM